MQTIFLEGTDNTRDFEGTVNREGYRVRPQMLIRSRHLHDLTPGDITLLKEKQHLSKIIDLRTDTEAENMPDIEILGVKNLRIPLVKESTAGITHEDSTDESAAQWALPDMKQLYRSIVTDTFSILQLEKVLKEIMSNDEGAVLWHCTEGKDRCGIISALVLSLLDVDRQKIFDDYLMTNLASQKRAKAFSKMVLQKTGSKEKAQEIEKVFLADQTYLQSAFDAIEEQNESISSFFIEKLNISPDDIETFQKKCLEKQ